MSQGPLQANAHLVDRDGFATRYFRSWLEALRSSSPEDSSDTIAVLTATVNGIQGQVASALDLVRDLESRQSVPFVYPDIDTDQFAIMSALVPGLMARPLNEVPIPVGSVDFSQEQAVAFVVENRTSDPSSPVVGQLWLRTDLI